MRRLLPIIAVFVGLASIAVLVLFELIKTPKQETEMIEREDEAMSKVPDDTGEMARWVP
jgi:hypothetical protein